MRCRVRIAANPGAPYWRPRLSVHLAAQGSVAFVALEVVPAHLHLAAVEVRRPGSRSLLIGGALDASTTWASGAIDACPRHPPGPVRLPPPGRLRPLGGPPGPPRGEPPVDRPARHPPGRTGRSTRTWQPLRGRRTAVWCQEADMPASILCSAPVTQEDSSDARNSTSDDTGGLRGGTGPRRRGQAVLADHRDRLRGHRRRHRQARTRRGHHVFHGIVTVAAIRLRLRP